ncbi:unnamed protein product [Ambrosiozyma monospora]|uniref:Unnamed protein product n=1 Tax=Ambrosiozyma monospora TaxID=43982 RepID=A0ACB5T3P5_AMBMO|nr:unnamed protein product [Ambrosiozyma monospora]
MLRKQVLTSSKTLYRSSLVQARTFHFTATIQAKSPYQVFVDTFKQEWKKSSELSDQIKQLKSATDEMSESEAFKKAKDAYEKAQKGSGAVAKGVHKTAEVVGDAAQKVWESPVGQGVRTTVNTTADVLDKAAEPIRQTKVYKDVHEVFDEDSRYGLYETKEQRKARRERELKNKPKAVKANDEAVGRS